MSNPINDGGPAFSRGVDTFGEVQIGMSLRDWFAGQADVAIYEPLQTLKAKLSRQPTISELAAYVAEIRTIEADAMLAAREVK
jgi:hypothetical protein